GRFAERIYRLAVHRLTIFANDPAVNLLPQSYQPGSPVILHAPSRWETLYMREWLLVGVPEQALLHVGSTPNDFPTAELAVPPGREVPAMEALSETELTAFVDGAEQVWLLTVPEVEAQNALFFARMEALGFVPTPYPIQHPRFRISRFAVWRFQRAPQVAAPVYRFGAEDITLLAWELVGREAPAPCADLRLQSWWTSEAVPLHNYSLTAVLVDAAGAPLINRDAAPGDTLMQLWAPGQLIFDERVLPLPCDLPPGNYDLLVGLYHVEQGAFTDLSAHDAAGHPVGNRAYLTTLVVP
ncbi:MAG: hypothetical protein HC915_20330, partial [Anaerolineae bacterium]|nr:hypothetical protein [Anaerolineae bacterium]